MTVAIVFHVHRVATTPKSETFSVTPSATTLPASMTAVPVIGPHPPHPHRAATAI
jgi:hypothetical protein